MQASQLGERFLRESSPQSELPNGLTKGHLPRRPVTTEGHLATIGILMTKRLQTISSTWYIHAVLRRPARHRAREEEDGLAPGEE